MMSTLLLALALSRVAMVQFDADARFGDTAANVERLGALIAEAAGHGAKLVILPEGSTHGYATAGEVWCAPGQTELGERRCRDVTAVAETIPGGTVERAFEAMAREHQVYVVYSAIEREGRRYYNASVLVGPQGYVTKYRKRLLYYLDQGYASVGTGDVTADLPFGRVGFLICADANADGYFARYKRLGVGKIITIMSWDQDPDSGRAAALFFADKAREHGVTILAADDAAWDGTAAYFPDGERVRAGLPDPGVGAVGIAYADLE